jgi:two-component system LytT family response regulator
MTNKIKTLVIEDSKPNRDVLLHLLSQYFPDIDVIKYADSSTSAYNALCEQDYDLVLSDIELPRGNVFDVFKDLKKLDKFPFKFEIIFITSQGHNRTHWTNALKLSAVDFLDKPIQIDQLKEAIANAKDRIIAKKSGSSISILFDNLELENKNKKIGFHLVRGQIEYLRVGDILYLEADGTITHVYQKNGQKIAAMKNLGYYAKTLQEDKSFFRISDDKLINCDSVQSFDAKNRLAIFQYGLKLNVSRRNAGEFKKHMEALNGGDDMMSKIKALFKALMSKGLVT